MIEVQHGWTRDVALRAAGLVLFAFCWMLTRWVLHVHDAGHSQELSLPTLLTATTGFACFSTGAILTALGSHIFDQVEVSPRWTRQPFTSVEPREPRPAFARRPGRDDLSTFIRQDAAPLGAETIGASG